MKGAQPEQQAHQALNNPQGAQPQLNAACWRACGVLTGWQRGRQAAQPPQLLPGSLLSAWYPHLEAAGALGQVGVAVHPVQAVHVHAAPAAGAAGQQRAQQVSQQPGCCQAGAAIHSLEAPALSTAHTHCKRMVSHVPAVAQQPSHRHHPTPQAAIRKRPQAHRESVSLVLRLQRKPISPYMSSPFLAARVSMKGQSK